MNTSKEAQFMSKFIAIHLFIISVVIFPFLSSAQTQNFSQLPAYYPDSLILGLSKTHGPIKDLKELLFDILSKHHLVSANGDHDKLADACKGEESLEVCYSQKSDMTYVQARKYLFGQLHLYNRNGKYKLIDVYCHREVGEEVGVGPGLIPNSDEINCEHTWPQSLFNPKFPENQQKVDLHHLFPVDSRANSTRGNHQERDLMEERDVHESCRASQVGIAENRNGTIKAFTPPLEHRGNVARALFYFSVRYKLSLDNDYEKNLREWNKEDPVDQDEQNRNEEIFKLQFNRNPFIDSPELVDKVIDF